MKNVSRYLLSLVAFALFVVAPRAQTSTFPYDHIHLNVPDAAAASEWYEKNFGGTRITEAPNRIMFGSTRLMFLIKKDALPSAGSSIDHIGLSVADLDANPITLGGHRAAIYDVRFSPDGTRLITGSRDLTARVFAIATDDLVAIAESKVTRSLTDAECQRYLHVETCADE